MNSVKEQFAQTQSALDALDQQNIDDDTAFVEIERIANDLLAFLRDLDAESPLSAEEKEEVLGLASDLSFRAEDLHKQFYEPIAIYFEEESAGEEEEAGSNEEEAGTNTSSTTGGRRRRRTTKRRKTKRRKTKSRKTKRRKTKH